MLKDEGASPATATDGEERAHPVHLLRWKGEGLPPQLVGGHDALAEVSGQVFRREVERVCVDKGGGVGEVQVLGWEESGKRGSVSTAAAWGSRYFD